MVLTINRFEIKDLKETAGGSLSSLSYSLHNFSIGRKNEKNAKVQIHRPVDHCYMASIGHGASTG